MKKQTKKISATWEVRYIEEAGNYRHFGSIVLSNIPITDIFEDLKRYDITTNQILSIKTMRS